MKDRIELRTRNAALDKTREQIQKDTEEFLKNGGTIKIIPIGVTASDKEFN